MISLSSSVLLSFLDQIFFSLSQVTILILESESELRYEDQEGETFRPLLAAPTFCRQTIGQDASNNSSRAQPENLVIPNKLCKVLVQPFFIIPILKAVR